MRADITAIYEGRRYGQPDVHGTAWGAWQAVVAYNDHEVTRRQTRISTAAERILDGQKIGSRAMALLP